MLVHYVLGIFTRKTYSRMERDYSNIRGLYQIIVALPSALHVLPLLCALFASLSQDPRVPLSRALSALTLSWHPRLPAPFSQAPSRLCWRTLFLHLRTGADGIPIWPHLLPSLRLRHVALSLLSKFGEAYFVVTPWFLSRICNVKGVRSDCAQGSNGRKKDGNRCWKGDAIQRIKHIVVFAINRLKKLGSLKNSHHQWSSIIIHSQWRRFWRRLSYRRLTKFDIGRQYHQ